MEEVGDLSKDALGAAFFTIELQGAIAGTFKSLENLGTGSELSEYKSTGAAGGKSIGSSPERWNAVTLKQGVTDDRYFWNWRRAAEQGDVQAAKRNCSILMHNAKGDVLARWEFISAWPRSIKGPSGDSPGEIAIEELEIVYEKIRRVP